MIKVQNLHYAYEVDGATSPILKNLNLHIPEGELVAICGPSGSGKSTLLYLLGLLADAQQGQIFLAGRPVSHLTALEKAQIRNQHIGFIFQQFHLLPKTSVLENILLPTRYVSPSSLYSDIDKARSKAMQLAQFVGLGDRLHHHPNQLSGGQQQRVAICRALMNDPQLILADEPTGNLDSVSATQILQLLKDLNRSSKKTIVIITHDQEVAKQCDRIIRIRDGAVVSEENLRVSTTVAAVAATAAPTAPAAVKTVPVASSPYRWDFFKNIRHSLPLALKNLGRNKTRTALTMVGISVGIAAVLSMITLGQYTKSKVLSGYAELGVNTFVFYGFPNWQQKATDKAPINFQFFNWERDLIRLKGIFPQIHNLSPILMGRDGAVDFGGRSIDQDIRIMGINEEGIKISNRHLLIGRNFSPMEIEHKSSVCLIGSEIAQRLFAHIKPLGQVLKVAQGESSYGCRIIGVLTPTTSNKEFSKPNLQLLLPFTTYQALCGDWWSSQIKQVLIQAQPGSDVERVGKGVRAFFEQKYGISGKFRVDSDSVLVAQMRRFMVLFTVLLSSIAFVTLTVGGVGITNMMLVSVSERFREIGLRKAVGATGREIRIQFMMESVLVCLLAGIFGLLLGFCTYSLAIWTASKFIAKLQFAWTYDVLALSLSLFSIIAVGILSGIFPAIKAEKLQVIEALRAE